MLDYTVRLSSRQQALEPGRVKTWVLKVFKCECYYIRFGRGLNVSLVEVSELRISPPTMSVCRRYCCVLHGCVSCQRELQ